MTLVDTSAWIHLLRPDGDPAVAGRVRNILEQGEACWCAMVRLELWNGAGGRREKRVLKEFEAALIDLPINEPVWECANDLARVCRENGVTVPATDLLVTACAAHHGARIETTDRDFEKIARASKPTR